MFIIEWGLAESVQCFNALCNLAEKNESQTQNGDAGFRKSF